MTAVVLWPSRVGGSPIIPTRSTPPFLGDCACPADAASHVATATRVSTARSRNGVTRMAYVLPVWTASDDTTAAGIDWRPHAAQSVSRMAPSVVIHDTTIVTADAAGTILYDAALAVEGRRIIALGPSAEVLARHPGASRVDGRGRAVLPGLANTHTHLPRVLARGIYEDLSPPHTPPFTGGLAPLPTPALGPEEERVMVRLGA